MPYVSFNPKISEYKDFKNETFKEKLFYSLIALLSTPKGTHPYDPNYGTGIRNYILETDHGQLQSLIEQDVSSAIQNYIPELFSQTKVIVTRDIHKSGYGYVYKLNIVIADVIVDFDVLKNGTLMYSKAFK